MTIRFPDIRLPAQVEICEVGPRDGFQYEEKPIPTDLKLQVIAALANAGIKRIQVASFVHPERVPQMADANAVVQGLPRAYGTVFSALALNMRGMERAHDSGIRHVDVSIATNETHSRDNANMTVDEGVRQAERMIEFGRSRDIEVQLGLQTVFGFNAPGDTSLDLVVGLAERFSRLGIESLSLADTTGLANPLMIVDRVKAVRDAASDVPIVLHLHDTRGLGMANVFAALQMGITRFDTSLGGLGGCPFIPGATGNIATEDTVYLLESMGVRTGIDAGKVAAASFVMEHHLGHELSGRLVSLRRKGAPV